jgi:hypothetical protein
MQSFSLDQVPFDGCQPQLPVATPNSQSRPEADVHHRPVLEGRAKPQSLSVFITVFGTAADWRRRATS